MSKIIAFLAGVIVGAVGIIDIACIVVKSDNRNDNRNDNKNE